MLRNPEGRSKTLWSSGCYITPGLLSHYGASCYGAGNTEERKTPTQSRLCMQPCRIFSEDFISLFCNYIYIPLWIPLISIWPHLHVSAGNMNSHERQTHSQKRHVASRTQMSWIFFSVIVHAWGNHFSHCSRSNLVFVFRLNIYFIWNKSK